MCNRNQLFSHGRVTRSVGRTAAPTRHKVLTHAQTHARVKRFRHNDFEEAV